MFPTSVIRKLARSEEMFAQSQTYFGATVVMSGPVDVDAMSVAFDTLLQAHPVLAGHLERGPDGLHQIVVDDFMHPGLWVTGGEGRPASPSSPPSQSSMGRPARRARSTQTSPARFRRLASAALRARSPSGSVPLPRATKRAK